MKPADIIIIQKRKTALSAGWEPYKTTFLQAPGLSEMYLPRSGFITIPGKVFFFIPASNAVRDVN